MAKRVCPWWLGYLLASPIRRWFSNPAKVLAPYVREGITVLEPGPGMGFFTIELARMVGPGGRVVAVDVQSRMLEGLKRRAAKAGLADRIDARRGAADSMSVKDLAGAIDFVLAFAVVHELPSPEAFFREAASTMKPGATLLFVEPAGHVSAVEFEAELRAAGQAGLEVTNHPAIPRSRAALLRKA